MSLPFRGSCRTKNTHSAHEPAISTSVVISSEATNRHFLSPFLRHLSLNNANPARRCYGRSPRGRPPAARGRCPFPGRRLAPPGQGRQRGPGCRARSARRDAAGEAPPHQTARGGGHLPPIPAGSAGPRRARRPYASWTPPSRSGPPAPAARPAAPGAAAGSAGTGPAHRPAWRRSLRRAHRGGARGPGREGKGPSWAGRSAALAGCSVGRVGARLETKAPLYLSENSAEWTQGQLFAESHLHRVHLHSVEDVAKQFSCKPYF